MGAAAIGTTDETTTVSEVVGDMLEVRDRDGSIETIRLSGIGTPETAHHSKSQQYSGQEASTHLRDLVDGKAVMSKKDQTGNIIDRHGPQLRHILVDDESMNAYMALEDARPPQAARPDPQPVAATGDLGMVGRSGRRGSGTPRSSVTDEPGADLHQLLAQRRAADLRGRPLEGT